MIVTKLQGGLGNQIFQWAAGKSLSIDCQTECYFDDQFYFSSGTDTKRTLDLTKLPNVETLKMVGLISTNHYFLIRDNFIHENYLNKIRYSTNSSKSSNIVLDGYWQSEKYFLNNKNQILQELRPNENIVEKIKTVYPFIFAEKTVSLHVRRTDYLTSNGFHPTMSKEYYSNAIEECNAQNNKKIIFSDDIEWCKENLIFSDCVFIEGNSNIIDLYLMSFCSDNIIANSSFSWWAAYMNCHENKKIVAPKTWFGSHSTINTSDIIPENWTTI